MSTSSRRPGDRPCPSPNTTWRSQTARRRRRNAHRGRGGGARPAPAAKPRSLFRRGWEVFAENKLALAGLALVVFIVLFCFVGPLIYTTDQVHTNLTDVLCQPSGKHLLGCDNVGYDVLGRLMVGGQTSIEVGLAAALVAVLFGTLYGAVSGFSAASSTRS